MKMPKGWERVEAGWYINKTKKFRGLKVWFYPSVTMNGRANWHAFRGGSGRNGLNKRFRTAREAFRALGVEVDK